MADLVSTQVLHNGTRRYIVNIKNSSDGTGESAVVKIDKSTLIGPAGTEPSKLVIEKVHGQCTGMRVRAYFDRTSPIEAFTADGGEVELEFCHAGGIRDTGTGGTGDLLVTTTGHTAGDSYDLTIHCRLTV